MNDSPLKKSNDSYTQNLYKLELENSYTCVEVLHDSPTGRTEKVIDSAGATHIRKYLPLSDGVLSTAAQLISIDSPHLARLENFYLFGDKVVLIIQYIEGMTLREYINTVGPLSLSQTMSLLSGVFTGVELLHALLPTPLIHRDINPNNIIINKGNAYLIDFGIARTYDSTQQADTHNWGTKGYIAPEQIGYGKSVPQSDIYSLAASVLFALTGDDATLNIEASLSQSTLPEPIKNVIRKATSISSAERYQTVREFQEALKGALISLGPQSAHAFPPPQQERLVSQQVTPQQSPVKFETPIPGMPPKSNKPEKAGFIYHSAFNYAWKIVVGLVYGLIIAASVFNIQQGQSLDQIVLTVYVVELIAVDFFLFLPLCFLFAFVPEYAKKMGIFKEKRLLVGAAFLAGGFIVTLLIFIVLYAFVNPSVLQAVDAFNASLSSN